MLIKFGNNVVINVIKIINYSVGEREEHVLKKKGGWFERDTFEPICKYDLELNYYNVDNIKAKYTLVFTDQNTAMKALQEVTQQVKELELENMTATLENAIRNS